MNPTSELIDAVQIYFDALYYCDTDKLNSVFHESSSLFDADDGRLFVEPIASFAQDVATRISPASKGQLREDEILMVDWLSPLSAMVKVRLRAHQNIFVDHLGFVKGEAGWKIVSKIWHLERESLVEGTLGGSLQNSGVELGGSNGHRGSRGTAASFSNTGVGKDIHENPSSGALHHHILIRNLHIAGSTCRIPNMESRSVHTLAATPRSEVTFAGFCCCPDNV